MTQEQWAQEQLITIRSLMERASLYRAISAPTAIFAGFFSGCAALFFPGDFLNQFFSSSLSFVVYWIFVFFIVSGFNFLFLAHENKKLGTPLISRGMKSALTDFCPPLLVGGVIGLFLTLGSYESCLIVSIWCICYGLALLSTRHYAPRSLLLLGWAFVIVGLTFLFLPTFPFSGSNPSFKTGNLLMAFSFSLLHLIYGAATWLNDRRETALRNAPAIEM